MKSFKRKVHFDRGKPWLNHQVQMWFGGTPVFTPNPEEVTCEICLRMIKRAPRIRLVTAESLRGIRTKATEEENKRYQDRKAKEKAVIEKCREENWKIIDGVPEEEMKHLRRLMYGLSKKEMESEQDKS